MRTEINTEQLEIIEEVVDGWSEDKSIDRAVEELIELSHALLKRKREKQFYGPVIQIKEEMADVHIALKHLEFIYGEYQSQINMKMEKCKNQ